MSCTSGNFIITEDVNNKVKDEIKKLTTNPLIQQIIANKVNNGLFKEWILDTYPNEFNKDNLLSDIKKQTLGKYLRHFIKTHFASVDNGVKENQNSSKNYFSSVSAKRVAIIYTAFLLNKEYRRQQSLDKEVRPDAEHIGSEVRKFVTASIVNEFNKRAKNYFNENPDINSAKEYLELDKIITDSKKEINNLKLQITDLENNGKLDEANEITNLCNEKIAAYNKNVSKIMNLKYETLINSGNIKLYNYAALYKNVTSNAKDVLDRFGEYTSLADSFFNDVLSYKSVLSIKSAFEEINEKDKISDDNYDEEDFENYVEALTEDNKDMMAMEWDNYIYNSYIKHFDNRLKLYLNSLFNLTVPYDQYEPGQNYDTSNELGVALPMNDRFIITQITNGASFYSIPDFINSVKRLANTIPSLYGLSSLVKKMEDDQKFARFVFTNFAKPVIAKTIIDIQRNTDPIVNQSNSAANPVSKMFFDLSNVIKVTYGEAFDERDSKYLNNIKNKSILEQKEFIINLFKKYFPNIDVLTLQHILYDSDEKSQKNIINKLNSSFTLLIEKLSHVVGREQEAKTEYGRASAEYNKKLEAYKNDPYATKAPNKPEYDASHINYEELNQPLIEISKIITPYFAVNTELNNITATGTTSSNLIKESYLTNFIKQLNYTIDEPGGELAGVNLLKDFLTQNNNFYYNNILFGIKNSKGELIHPGIFNRDNSGNITVNPNAKDLIKLALFDGVRDRNNLNGVNYRNMTQADYFLSMILAYNTPIDYNNEIGDKNKTNKLGNILLRIPSDASNNFMVQLTKYDYIGENGLFVYTDENGKPTNALKETIDTILLKINSNSNNRLISKSFIDFDSKIEDKYETWANDYYISTADLMYKNKAEASFIVDLLAGNISELNVVNYTKKFVENDVIIPIIYNNKSTKFVMYLRGTYNKEESTAENIKIDRIIPLTKHTETREKFDDVGFLYKPEKVQVFDSPLQTINNFLINNKDYLLEILYENNIIKQTINKDSAIYNGIRNQVIGEINDIVRGLNTLFKWNKSTKRFELNESTDNLFETYHYNGNKVIDYNGNLTGNVFKFNKLFKINDTDVTKKLYNAIFLYGGQNLIKKDRKGIYYLNLPKSGFMFHNTLSKNHDLQINLNNNNVIGLTDVINSAVDEWLIAYDNYIKTEIHKYDSVLNKVNDLSFNKSIEAIYNVTLNYMNMDSIFEGNSKYYKDAQTFLKRAKELQMSGSSISAYDFGNPIDGAITTLTDKSGNDIIVTIKDSAGNNQKIILPNGEELKLNTGFRAVTIANTQRGFEDATKLYDEVYKENYEKFILAGLEDKEAKSAAEKTASAIAKGYGDFILNGQKQKGSPTKINDAQSYITIYELARRRFANGTIDEYGDLISKLILPESEFDINDIDPKELQRFIQVEKNVYYDIQYDNITKEYYPRQIKNAEFVLIPNLLPKDSDLRKLANLMIENDIHQINTAETSKAANKNVLQFWDSKDEKILHIGDEFGEDAFDKQIKDNSNVEIYYYKNLHKQQDIVDHMVNKENKAGIQIMKKIQDNASTASQKVKDAVDVIQKAFTANIESDFQALLFQFGWKMDKNGKIYNAHAKPGTDPYILDFTDFYARGREEAQRLDMDSNFIEYLLPNKDGIVDMPTSLGVVSNKLESIAQAIFNSRITRQTLPGWHAVQVSTVGYANNLKYHPDVYVDISNPSKEIDKEQYDKLSKEEKDKYQKVAYVEALIPVWDNRIEDVINNKIKEGKTRKQAEQEVIDELNKQNLSKHIGYRIPTEGKQSVTILKIVGFLPRVYGSTIIVANEWVTQTGADFDVDTIYGIYHELREVGGKLYKIKPNLETDEYNTKLRYTSYINELIRDTRARTKDYIITAKNEKQKAYELINEARKAKKDFNDLNGRIKEIKLKLPKDIRKQIRLALDKFIKDKQLNDINKDKRIIDRLNTFIKNDFKDNKEVIDILNELINLYTERIEFNEDYREANISLFEKDDTGHNKFLAEANEQYFNDVSKIAKEAGLISYDEFKKLDIIAQQTRSARNNMIVDAMLTIMSDPTSREENYSRSNFDDIKDTIKELNEIAGTGFDSASVYNPFDQLRFMQNAIDGRKLKAFSVNRDTFNSINNKLHSYLNGNHAIVIKYDLTKTNKEGELYYDKNLIKSAYGDDCVIDEENNIAIVTHRMLGWSKTNRNVIGKLLTSYSSETTAHILDAIKEGAIFNETDYTFGTFKTLIDVGIDYRTAIAFLMQPAITRINRHHANSISIFGNEFDDPIGKTLKDLAIISKNKNIDENSTKQDIIDSFLNNEEFKDNFRKIWGVELSSNIFDTDITLDAETLISRLASNKESIQNSEFDLGILIAFNKFYTTTRNIEAIANIAKPDSFGAKQTIHSTRKIVDNVLNYYNYDTAVGKTITIDSFDYNYNFFSPFAFEKSLSEQIEDLNEKIKEQEEEYFKYAHSGLRGVERQQAIFKSLDIDNNIKSLIKQKDELQKKLDEQIEKEEAAEYSDNINKEVSKVKYTTFLQALYPGFGDRIQTENSNGDVTTEFSKKIDISKSKYPYLAALFQYVTNKSIEVNEQLFELEKTEIDNLVRYIEKRFGRNFTDAEYVAFKKYMVSTLYNEIAYLNLPVILNNHGQLITDDTILNTDKYDFWNTERNRIFGYKETISSFTVDDIGNPTPEELREYARLTPLQKVMFIKSNYIFGKGIFDYIETSKYNSKERDNLGYSRNRLTVNTEGINIEELFIQFNKAFFNNDPFVKLAAVDLIKYAFIVEGFNFKRNSISKIIPNATLLAEVNQGGMGIISTYKNLISELYKQDLYEYNTDRFLRNFVRSHSDLIKTRVLPKPGDKDHTNVGNKFLTTIRNEKAKGFVVIPAIEAYNDLLETIKLDPSSQSQYIKLKYYPSLKGRAIETLYEIRNIYNNDGKLTNITLIPLNLLDSNENIEVSINNNNHEYFVYNFYRQIVNDIQGVKTNTPILSPEEAKIPNYRFIGNIDTTVDVNAVLDFATTSTGISQAQAKTFMNKIANWYKDYNGIVKYGNVQDDTGVIKKLFKNNTKAIIQNIDIGNGVFIKFKISKENSELNKTLYYLHKYYIKNGEFPKGTLQFQIDYHNSIIWNDKSGKNPVIYRISVIEDSKTSKNETISQNQINKEKQEYDASRIRFVDNITIEDPNQTNTYDNVANLIIRDLEYKAHKNDAFADSIYQEFSTRGISTDSLEKISEKENDIYYLSANYYVAKGTQLLEKLSGFDINGTKYSLNPSETVEGKSLYDALRENPEYRDDFFKLLLEAKTFGDGVYQILSLPIKGEDPVVDSAIRKIQQTINNVRNNNNLKIAFDAMFNYYLAKEYSENPNVRQGLIKITDIFNDADWFDTQFSDVAELNHKQIQVIVKMANEIVAESHFKGLDEVKVFNEEYERIMAKYGTFEFSHIITPEGKFIQPINQKFFDDIKAIFEKVRNVIDTYGYNSPEYHKAKLEKDIWLRKNTYQEMVDSYYDQSIALREQVFKDAFDYYVEYQQLIAKIYSNYIPYNQLTEEQRKERDSYWDRIKYLRSPIYSEDHFDEFLNFIESNTEHNEKAEALDNYIKANARLNQLYKHDTESAEYREVLIHNLEIIENYDRKYPNKTIGEKLKDNENYKDAYLWLNGNAIRKLNPELKKQLDEAYKLFGSKPEYKKVFATAINVVPLDQRYDAFGNIIGTVYTLEQQKRIKELAQKKYYPYGELDENGEIKDNVMNVKIDVDSDAGLIKEIPDDVANIVFKSEFYRDNILSDDEKTAVVRAEKRKIYTRINKIVSNAFDEHGRFDILKLYNNYVDENGDFDSEEIKELINLYQRLRILNKNTANEFDKNSKSPISLRRNIKALRREEMKLSQIPGAYRNLFEKLLYDRKGDPIGTFIKDNGRKIANRFLFGFYSPIKINGVFANEYIDEAKTKAKQFLDKQVQYKETPYLEQAMKEAQEKGEDYFNEWLDANRVYNPYKHTYEWTYIWTRQEILPIGSESAYTWVPTDTHTKLEINDGTNYDKSVKDVIKNARNPLYKRYGLNYREDISKEYRNSDFDNLTGKELEMLDFLQKTVNNYATNYKSKRFVNQGFIPRMPTIKIDKKWYAKQALGTVGLQARNYNDREWHDIIDFSHDFDANFTMFDLIKGVGTRKHKPMPLRKDYENDEIYKQAVEDIKKENDEIDKENLKIDNELMNKNYKEVFNQLIYNGTEYLAREKTKDLIYIMIEDLKNRTANKVNNFGKLSKNKRTSVSDNTTYNQIEQNNTLSVFSNWARRFLFAEYKNLSPLNRYSDLLQNITSAKFMIFNLLGGVANVNTGWVNIFGEGFARDFFTAKEFAKASNLYLSKAAKMIGDFFDRKTNDKYVALTKHFDIVDYDRMLELARDNDVVERGKKINRFLYSFQSGGEHYMQNSILFAMLESHRVYKDYNGNIQVVNLNEYTADLDIKSFVELLRQEHPDLLTTFELDRKLALKDKDIQRQYDRFNRDFIADFIRGISDSKLRNDLAKEYNDIRKVNMKLAQDDFNKLNTVMSLFELEDGEIKIKPYKDENGNEIFITNKELGHIKWKVQQVNDKIHGVYNKLGGARIEQYWFGNLIMQYHKHLYPGIMKRFRVNGMFNESRGSIDYGSYVSAFKLAANIMKQVVKPNDNSFSSDTSEDAIKSFSTFMTRVFDIGNIIAFEWNVLPTWEKNNIRRILGDLCGIGAAFLIAFAIYLMTDDDDLKDDNFVNSCLYIADRLLTESKMYTITGLYSEGATLWSSPVAGLSTVKDLFKTVDLGVKYLIDPSFEVIYPNGLYKGKNKFSVIIQRNIPGYRIVKRLENISKNNNYYRINESTVSTRLAKSIADSIDSED